MDEETIAKNNSRMRGQPVTENADGTDATTKTPPAKPGEDTTEGETSEMPEPPEGFDDGIGGGHGMMGGRFEGFDAQAGVQDGTTWHPTAYLGMGAASVVLGIVISYACFSKCFHLKPGQTFTTLGRFLGCVGVAVVMAALLAVLGYFLPIWIG